MEFKGEREIIKGICSSRKVEILNFVRFFWVLEFYDYVILMS